MAGGITEQLNSALAGRYVVQREIGRGGMATVYLADDLRHQRPVALKVLNSELGAVLGVERFLAEIRVTASLHHPNLLPLFDSGEMDGLLFYVMPFIEGESLRARLEREKQLPIDQALAIAISVCGALDYAHRHGVIHRDLKPENILLHEGQPLVADFGIALAVTKAGGHRLTQTGLSLGTPQYMSPEQAAGDRVIDGRSDIYSLGAVLYETLTGEPPHIGTNAQAVIAKILTERPRSIRLTRETVPDHVEAATDRALAKLPADRWPTARDFAEGLQGRGAFVAGGTTTPAASSPRDSVRAFGLGARMRDPIVLMPSFLLLLAATTAGWLALRGRATPDDQVMRFSLALPTEMLTASAGGRTFDISQDGRTVVYHGVVATGTFHMFVRRLDDFRVKELPGTILGVDPSISPDGRWIVYTNGASLFKVPMDGGAPTALGPALLRGTAWLDANTVVAARDRGLWLVPVNGQPARALTSLDTAKAEQSHGFPVVSANGKFIFYQVLYHGTDVTTRIAVVALESGRSAVLNVAGMAPIGIVDDALIYVREDGSVLASRMDLRNLRALGDVIPLGEQISIVAGGAPRVALSRSGSLIYQSGAKFTQIALVDSTGASRPVLSGPKSYEAPRFSPDGRRIALVINTDIWIYDVASRTPVRLTTAGRNDRPEWTPDGRRVLYRTTRDGEDDLWWQNADGSGVPERFARVSGAGPQEGIVSPDGKWAVLRTIGTATKRDIYYRSMMGDTTLRAFAASEFEELMPRFSPNGEWLAYLSDESGATEVYVRRFPGPSGKIQISLDGGTEPLWAPGGKAIYYRRGNEVIAASLAVGPTISVLGRRKVFDGPYVTSAPHANYDVSPDGKSFLVVQGSGTDAEVMIVHNWAKEVRDRLRGAP